MPILEDLKEYAERATGLRRPGKVMPWIAPAHVNPTPSDSRTTVSSPTIPDGR